MQQYIDISVYRDGCDIYCIDTRLGCIHRCIEYRDISMYRNQKILLDLLMQECGRIVHIFVSEVPTKIRSMLSNTTVKYCIKAFTLNVHNSSASVWSIVCRPTYTFLM